MDNFYKYHDEQLILLLKEESPLCDKAFDTIFNRYSARLNSYCMFKAENLMDAEEIFEDTWLKFLDRIKNGKQCDNILPYIFSIARTISIDKYRQNHNTKSIEIEYKNINEMDEFANPFQLEEQLDNEELLSLVKLAASNLDDLHKDAFVLSWFGGMTHKEIAEILQISTGNAKMRCHRAMSDIIKMLRPYFIETSK